MARLRALFTMRAGPGARWLGLPTRIALCAAAAVGLWIGWRTFWFLCDDAFIAFRYVSNSMLGWGYTWNPPPFRPVEGYTSFLWVVLLDGVWRVVGREPPESANWLSLLFSAASLAVIVAMVLRLQLPAGPAHRRTALLGLVLFGTLTNRTFLAWTSSGLETALFGFLLLAWTHAALAGAHRGRALWAAALAAGLLALTRPDGLLFAAITAGLLGLRLAAHPGAWRSACAAGLPLLIPVLHVLWRRQHYGYWLPNTYYAKRDPAWPEAGVRYAAAFALEYAYWIWLALAAVAALRAARRGALAARLRARDEGTLAAIIVTGALALHFGYYTLVIGGDHFEFRVYQPYVPLALVSFAVVAGWAGLAARRTLAALAVMIAVGLPIPWLHWWQTRELATRRETFGPRYPVAPYLPALVRPYGAAWDHLQAWLNGHGIGIRHQEHAVLTRFMRTLLPSRAVGARIEGPSRDVLAYHMVGVAGWVLPRVAILDYFGLNDAVVAHMPPAAPDADRRSMAHNRAPPDGYFECFRPNVFVRGGSKFVVTPRETELTDDEIRSCEARFSAARLR